MDTAAINKSLGTSYSVEAVEAMDEAQLEELLVAVRALNG